MTDTEVFGAALKEFFDDSVVEDQIKATNALAAKVKERPAKDFGGLHVTQLIRLGRNAGHVASGEGGPYPTAGAQRYQRYTIPMRTHIGSVQFTTDVIQRSAGGDKVAFISVMEAENEGLIEDMGNDQNRMAWGAGRGTLAVISASANSATQTLKDPLGVVGTVNPNRYINDGDILAVVNPGPPVTTVRGSGSVISVSTDGTQVTFDRAINTTTDDLIVRAGATGLGATAVGSTAADREPMGLLGMVDDATYMATNAGLSRITYPQLRSQVFSQVNTLSADIIQRMLDAAEQLGGGTIKELWGHHSARRAYLVMTEHQRRYIGGDLMTQDAGTKAAKGGTVAYGDIPWHVDRHAPYGIIFGLDFDTMERYVLKAGGWEDQGNGGVLKLAMNTSSQYIQAYVAFWESKYNFHIRRPNKCGRLDGVSVTAALVHNY